MRGQQCSWSRSKLLPLHWQQLSSFEIVLLCSSSLLWFWPWVDIWTSWCNSLALEPELWQLSLLSFRFSLVCRLLEAQVTKQVTNTVNVQPCLPFSFTCSYTYMHHVLFPPLLTHAHQYPHSWASQYLHTHMYHQCPPVVFLYPHICTHTHTHQCPLSPFAQSYPPRPSPPSCASISSLLASVHLHICTHPPVPSFSGALYANTNMHSSVPSFLGLLRAYWWHRC